MRYGIITALEFEESLFRQEMGTVKELKILNKSTYSGKIGQHEVVVVHCGIGKVAAAICAQTMIQLYHPDIIINTGCAGALDPSLKIGDVVVSESVVEWDLDLRQIGLPLGYIDALECVEMKADEKLLNQIIDACPGELTVRKGLVVSGDQFVSTASQREHILKNFPNALCAEMEGAAIGQVCLQNGIPFCIIRAMSDTANGDSGVDFATFAPIAGEKSASWIIKMLKN